MHYVMDDLEVEFLLDAVEFVARHGGLFLSLYDFNLYDGSWGKKDDSSSLQRFSLESALNSVNSDETPMPFEERQKRYSSYLDEALALARKLQKRGKSEAHKLEGTLSELQFFALPECCMNPETKKAPKGLIGKIKSIFRE